MKQIRESIKAILESDKIYFYKNFNFVEEYDESIEGAEEKAKEVINFKIEAIKRNAFWCSSSSSDHYLYGGRLKIRWYNSFELRIDGVLIYNLSFNDRFDTFLFSDRLEADIVISYLNAIAAHGLDSFFENYKTSLNAFAAKVETMLEKEIEKLNSSDSDYSSKIHILNSSKRNLKGLMSTLFLVQLHLPLGIENERIEAAYNQIQNFVF